MKIMLYIDDMGRGGAQRVMKNLAEHFSNMGLCVVMINDYDIPLEEQYILDPSIKRICLDEIRSERFISRNLSRMIKLRKHVKEEKPDIVLSFLGVLNLRMLVSTLGLELRKYVSERTDPYADYGHNQVFRIIVNLIYNTATGTIFQTDEAEEYFWKGIKRKSRIIWNPVSSKLYDMNYDGERRNIVTVGRLGPEKNHKLLIDAFYCIKDKITDHNLIIYGDGALKKQLIEYTEELGLKGRVHFRGEIDDPEEEVIKSKLFVLTSNYEGMPNALMEAMALGVPCVSTNCPIGGPRMLIRNDGEGRLVPVNDCGKLSECMLELMATDESKLQSLSSTTRKRAEEFRDSNVFKAWDEFLGVKPEGPK